MFRIVLALVLLAAGSAAAQEHQHPAPAPPAQDHAHHAEQAGESLFPARDASGTSWLPDRTPMHAGHARAGSWELMWHGTAFLQFINESAPEHRGAHQTGSINWVMGMARRRAGGGRVGVRTMLSVEPWTIRDCGYPDLLATGETCDGDTIHDRQHPHDLFMELALEYERPLGRGLRWFVYGGPVGEPALGPVAFPHRISAMSNPIAPIGHHWLDATHITFGVDWYSRRETSVRSAWLECRSLGLQRPRAGRESHGHRSGRARLVRRRGSPWRHPPRPCSRYRRDA